MDRRLLSEIRRLEQLGWQPPPVDEQGVRTAGEVTHEISYPESGLAVLTAERGQGYWFDHRADEVAGMLARVSVQTIWDVGAGAGSMVSGLGAHGVDVVAVEPIRAGCVSIADLGNEVFCGTLDQLGLPDASLRAIGLFDVIEHLERPDALLREAWRILEPDGHLVCTVPALQWLWSDEDVVAGHFRRYDIAALTRELTDAGFDAEEARYVFASLVPLAAMVRVLPYRLGRRKSPDEITSAIGKQLQPSSTVDAAIRTVLKLESRASRRVRIPFGLSVVGLFRKRSAQPVQRRSEC